MLFAQGLYHAQNLVVGLALGKAHGQAHVQRLGLEKKLATDIAMARAVQRQAFGHVCALRAGQCIQRAAGLAGIARHFGHPFFVAVQFFQHDHGEVDVMFLKAEQAHGVVHQHVGVQHEKLGGTLRLFRLGSLRSGSGSLAGNRCGDAAGFAARVGCQICGGNIFRQPTGTTVKQIHGLRFFRQRAFCHEAVGFSSRLGHCGYLKSILGQQGCALGGGGGEGHGKRA